MIGRLSTLNSICHLSLLFTQKDVGSSKFSPLTRPSGSAPESTQDIANDNVGNSFGELSNSANAQIMKNGARTRGILTASTPKGQ